MRRVYWGKRKKEYLRYLNDSMLSIKYDHKSIIDLTVNQKEKKNEKDVNVENKLLYLNMSLTL